MKFIAGCLVISCAYSETCSTPSGLIYIVIAIVIGFVIGSGTCMSTSSCKAEGGTSFAGYCSGPADNQCCVHQCKYINYINFVIHLSSYIASGSSCTCNQYNMCTNVPADNNYYLTSFCDASVACGSWSGNCNEYYSADYSRFGCNSIISCCQGSNCINLKVIDGKLAMISK